MSSKDSEGHDPLESLIARYLKAEKSVHRLKRDTLIEENPELAGSLQEFFVNHDRMKRMAAEDTAFPAEVFTTTKQLFALFETTH